MKTPFALTLLSLAAVSAPGWAQDAMPGSTDAPAQVAAPVLTPAATDAPAAADAPVAAPTTVAPPAPLQVDGVAKRRSFALAAFEMVAIDTGMLAFNNLASRQEFAQVSLDSIKSHFDGRRPWTVDVDYFLTNQFGHPYQGSLSMAAARSSGLNFWWSTLAPILASLAWELTCEVDAPSVNDQITTSLGGMFLGEVLHRGALMLIDNEAGLGYQVAAFFVDPIGTVNRAMFNHELDANDVDHNPPAYGEFRGGFLTSWIADKSDPNGTVKFGGYQGSISGDLIYGLPGDITWRYRFPFSHFAINAGITIPGGLAGANLNIRGLLLGDQFTSGGGAIHGLWGLFGMYDFNSNSYVRISSVALGIGTSFQWRTSESVVVQGTAVGGFVPFGSSGDLGLDQEVYRDYNVGIGPQVIADVRVLFGTRAYLRLNLRNWVLFGAYQVQSGGYQATTYVTPSFMVKLHRYVGLVLDVPVIFTNSKTPSQDRRLSAVAGRISVAFLSNGNLGVVQPVPLQ